MAAKLTHKQLALLRRVTIHGLLDASLMSRGERAVARGLTHRSEPLLRETPYHLWNNPRGPTYGLSVAGVRLVGQMNVSEGD